jgi:hypothetical protein
MIVICCNEVHSCILGLAIGSPLGDTSFKYIEMIRLFNAYTAFAIGIYFAAENEMNPDRHVGSGIARIQKQWSDGHCEPPMRSRAKPLVGIESE